MAEGLTEREKWYKQQFLLLEKLRDRFDFDWPRGTLICKTCGEDQLAISREMALLHVCKKNPAPTAKEPCQHDELTMTLDLSLTRAVSGAADCNVNVILNCANCAKPFRIKEATVIDSKQSK